MSKHWYNNGKINVFREYQPEGFIPGMLDSSKKKMSESKKGTVGWCKGLTKETDKRVKQVSDSQKGKVLSEERRRKISEGTKRGMAKPEVRKKLSNSKKGKHLSNESLKTKLEKEYITKSKNNSFNSSKPEEKLYHVLIEKYGFNNVKRRYKDYRYPFYCDFYIPSEDLFIELNAHWTHGGKPYDPNDKECQDKLKLWQEKAKQSQFYANAIKTWTERDVEKQRVAKENNINYKFFYDI